MSQLREELEREHPEQEGDDGHGEESDHLLRHQTHSQQPSLIHDSGGDCGRVNLHSTNVQTLTHNLTS